MAIRRVKSSRTGRITWSAIVNLPPDDSGKRRQWKRNAATRADAKRIEAELIRLRDEGAPTNSDRVTVDAFMRRWLERQNENVRESTQDRYRQLADHVTAVCGHVLLSKLTPLHLIELYETLRKPNDTRRGLSAKTALNVHRLVKKALRDAERWSLVGRNVADLVDAPRAHRFEYATLSRDELRRAFEASDAYGIGAIVRVLAWTGLRVGEAIALQWSDVDSDAARITVRQSIDTRGRLSRPKTERGRRVIAVSPATLAVLDTLGTSDGYVFVAADGNPWSQNAIGYRWKRARKDAKLPRARLHDLRHAHASHLLADGWPLAVVSARLGHSNVATTLAIYTHVIPGQDAELTSSRLDEAFK